MTPVFTPDQLMDITKQLVQLEGFQEIIQNSAFKLNTKKSTRRKGKSFELKNQSMEEKMTQIGKLATESQIHNKNLIVPNKMG
eukprot:UN17752